MNIEIYSNSNTKARLTVTVEPEDYLDKVEKKTKEFSKKVSLKGFRPGKAPLSYVKKLYGTHIKYEEINQILAQNVSKFLNEKKINLLREPIPLNSISEFELHVDTAYKFNFDLFIVPDFETPLQFKLKKYDVVISNELLDEKLNELSLQFATPYDKEKIDDENDLVTGELSKKSSENLPQSTGFVVKKLSEKGKKIFWDKKINEIVNFEITEIFEHDSESLKLFAGTTSQELDSISGEYEFKITKISGLKPAELNPELFKKVFPTEEINLLDDFKNRYKSILNLHAQNIIKEIQKKEIEKWISQNIHIEISQEYLELRTAGTDTPKENLEKLLKDEKIYEKYFKNLNLKFDENEFYHYLLDIYAARSGFAHRYAYLADWIKKLVKEQVDKMMANKNSSLLYYYEIQYIKDLVLNELLKLQEEFEVETISYEDLLKINA